MVGSVRRDSAQPVVVTHGAQRPGNGPGADEVGYLPFDRHPDTYGDLNSGAGAYYVIDFGAHATARPRRF